MMEVEIPLGIRVEADQGCMLRPKLANISTTTPS